ncbi:MAG: alpha/beta hydrolase [Clostridia bacterium]|nr:alpha/beta hydrolase [Clostridia bacterium]
MEFLHFGNRDGEKFVILPGLALKSVLGSAGAIVSAYSLIAENYDVYLFDHIPEEPEGYDIAGMVEDTLAAFGREDIDRAHLMGVSMGGMVAQTIALKAPERVASLILCSTAADTSRADPAVFEKWKTLAEERNVPALMDAFGESVYTPTFYGQYRENIIASGDGATEQDFRNFLISLDAVTRFDVHKEAGDISCPVFVLGAGDDRVLGRQAAYDLIKALDCPYYIYEGYGHGVYDEAPDYLSHIESFLKGLKTGS